MLTSMETVLEGTTDANVIEKAVQASAAVTANPDQMPFNNQVRSPLRCEASRTVLSIDCRRKALE